MPLRNPNINYNKGWFFVTMQVAMNKSIFGLIDDKKCVLNDLGKRLAESWRYLATMLYPATYFDEFVLMPNHVHAIVKVGAEARGYDRANILGAGLRARTIISTFTSPQEREVMRQCLATKQPFVWVRPGGLPTTIYSDLQADINEGRALLLSPVPEGTGVNKQRAIWCNRYVLNQAKEVRHGAISRGGMLETLLKAKGIKF